MTTVAWDGKVLAADTQTTHCDTVTNIRKDKVHKVGSVLFGFAGTICHSETIRQWLEDGAKFPGPEFDGECIVVPKRGRAYWLESKAPEPVYSSFRYMAIGSGARFAIGAMAAGMSAKTAVRIAIRHDVYSGGAVRYLAR